MTVGTRSGIKRTNRSLWHLYRCCVGSWGRSSRGPRVFEPVGQNPDSPLQSHCGAGISGGPRDRPWGAVCAGGSGCPALSLENHPGLRLGLETLPLPQGPCSR